jgi:hypothetical protein
MLFHGLTVRVPLALPVCLQLSSNDSTHWQSQWHALVSFIGTKRYRL